MFITQARATIENNWDGSTYEVVKRDINRNCRKRIRRNRWREVCRKGDVVVGPTGTRGCESL